ncbi:MAG TPA: hypothetical protein VGM25_11170 [Caulobacteraceae bacterium]|jgi:hypothetical protein
MEAPALLVSGGDARVTPDPASGLNRYGCGASPDIAVAAFGSSTCSTISTAAFAAVERLAGRLSAEALGGDESGLYGQELQRIRVKLAGLLGLQDQPGLKTILSPSGTDLHRLALHLVAAGASAPPLVILPEPHETGGGVVAALGGQIGPTSALRFAITAPNLEAALLRPQIMTARSRAADGTLRPAHQIDEEIAAIAASAARAGRKVLLVTMDVSKTGLISPSVACAQDLKQRFPELVEVMVDACQLRLAPATLAAYLRQDFLVAITGSKFITGPAFSAALLVPEAAAERIQASRLPRAVAELCLRGDLPEGWRGAPDLEAKANFGLVLRWEAALEEMRRFGALRPAAVARFFGDFAAAIGERLADDEAFEPAAVRPLERTGLGAAPSWDRIQTIFPFYFRRGGRPMSPVETLALQRLMAVDLGQWAGWAGAGRRIQLGQPAYCGRRGETELSAVRLCMSARLAVEALAPGGCGAKAMIDEALLALDKAAWLTTRLDR